MGYGGGGASRCPAATVGGEILRRKQRRDLALRPAAVPRRRYIYRRRRALARQRASLFRFFLHVATELGQRRVAVDLRGFDRRLILLVDLAYPRHATDRI